MEALKLNTFDDLLLVADGDGDQRFELINGEIVRRPMARIEHGFVQGNAFAELETFRRADGPGGWWIASEVSVRYGAHDCPSHDLAGWRKARLPERPRGVVEIAPDWVCEIVSPGHERPDHEPRDTLTLFLLLQRHRVPYYWLIWPEDRTLVAWQLDGDAYRVIATVTVTASGPQRARIPPFDAVEIDIGYLLGE